MAGPPLNANSTEPGVPAIAGTAVGTAVLGHSTNGPGVSAESDHFDACVANCHSATNSAVAAVNNAGGFGVRGLGKRGVVGESVDADGIGVFGKGGGLAGFFEGDVTITGKLNHGGFDAFQQINSLKEQLSTLQTQVNGLSGFGKLIQALGDFDQQLQARITVLERTVNDLAAQVATK